MYKRFLAVMVSLLFVALSVVRHAIEEESVEQTSAVRACPGHLLLPGEIIGRPILYRDSSSDCLP